LRNFIANRSNDPRTIKASIPGLAETFGHKVKSSEIALEEVLGDFTPEFVIL